MSDAKGGRHTVVAESTRVDLRRLGAVALVVFCLASMVGLVQLLTLTNQVLDAVQQQHSFGTASFRVPSASSTSLLRRQSSTVSENAVRVVIVYSSKTPHLTKLAESIAWGAQSAIENATIRLQTVENVTFHDDIAWADAILLGSHVINANVDPKMSKFISEWDFHADLSQKVGAAFVTAGGLSAGEELTMVNLLHSMMIFRMVIVGGERWTSAFGASAIVAEGPFVASNATNTTSCYPVTADSIHEIFQDKAIGLGKRAALVANALKQHVVV